MVKTMVKMVGRGTGHRRTRMVGLGGARAATHEGPTVGPSGEDAPVPRRSGSHRKGNVGK